MNLPGRDPVRLKRLLELFNAAIELSPEARAEFLDSEARGDPELRVQVQRLIERDGDLRESRTVSALERMTGELSELDAALDERDWQGETLGRYRLGEEIGRGGMGRVYAANRIDGEFAQDVAIKLVSRQAMNPALLRRFSNERRVLAALDHPGICRLLDAGTAEDGTPWVAMERVYGEPITRWCDLRRLDLAARLRLFRKVLAACAYAHRNLVVHRDIKPSNILVDSAGEPKLLDFGIAKPLGGGGEHTTGTAERYFTLSHAAPEQWRGDPITVGCDVYALGVLLYELVAGAPPFRFDTLTPGQIERLILDTPPLPPSRGCADTAPAQAGMRGFGTTAAWRRALRGDVDAIVERALRKDVGERYSSIEQFDADIRAFLEQRPVSARAGQRLYRLRKFVARNRLGLGVLSAGAVAALGLGTVILLQTLEVGRERDRAEQAIAFLKNAFYAADPARSAGADLSARQVMAAARADLEALREQQPQLFASLAAVIADVELGLGQVESAAGLAAQALASGGARLDEAQALRLLKARADLLADRIDDADGSLSEYFAHGGDEDAALRVVRGTLAIYQRRFDDARTDLEAAAQLPVSTDESGFWSYRARLELAYLLRLQERDEEALTTLDALLAALSVERPAGHPQLTHTRLRRVDVLRRLGRDQDAVAEARRAVEAIAHSYGREVPVYAGSLNTLANALTAAGQAEQAVPVLEEALSLNRAQLGGEHATTVRNRYNLAQAIAAADPQDPRADAHFAEVLAQGAQVFGPDGQTLAFFRAGMADSLLDRHRPQDAIEVLMAIPETVFATAPATVWALLERAHARACTAGSAPADACRRAADRMARRRSSLP